MPFTKTQDPMLKSIIDSMTEKVCVLDLSLNATYFNIGFADLIYMVHGFWPEINQSIYDKTDENYYNIWHPRLKNTLLGEHYEEIISSNTSKGPLHYKLTLTPLLYNEEIKGLIIKITDVTQEKLNELDLIAFRLLAENLPNTDVIFCDTSFNILIAGGGEMKKYGIDTSYFVGKNLISMASELNLEMLIPIYKKTLEGIPGNLQYEFGTDHYWLETYPIFEKNNVKNMIVITRNITELKSMNLKLQQLNNLSSG
jgi:PAS domain-containing protein